MHVLLDPGAPASRPLQLPPTCEGVAASGVQAITRVPLSQVKSHRWPAGHVWVTTSQRMAMPPSGVDPASTARVLLLEQALESAAMSRVAIGGRDMPGESIAGMGPGGLLRARAR